MKASGLLVVLLLVAGFAQAADEQTNSINTHNLSKRPYAAPVNQEKFEGATVIEQEVEVEKKHQPMRLHMLGKRPYAEKNTD